jgi:hypothetical protein
MAKTRVSGIGKFVVISKVKNILKVWEKKLAKRVFWER